MTNGNGYTPRLKQFYRDQLCGQLKDELGLSTVMQVPRVTKVTLNMGVGEAKTEAKALDSAIEELTRIAGQRAQVRRARKSIAGFKIREGMPIGARVTLRGDRMYDFLDRPISIAPPAHPRLPQAQLGLVRRPWQLLARHPRADHLPRDRLRRHLVHPRPRRRGHDDGDDRRAGTRAAARTWVPVRRPAARRTGVRNGKEVTDRQSSSHAAVPGAEVLAVQPLRPAAGGLQEVRALPDLPAGTRPRGRDPRHDQELVVGGVTC